MRIKYSKELLSSIVQDTVSVAQVLRKLGLKQSGGNHSHITKRLRDYEIDTSHFLGQAANSGPDHLPEKLSADKILVNDRFDGRREDIYRLRRALLEMGVEHKCAVCGLIPFWNGKYLQLQIDHINGIGTDNRIENLRFICGNCYIQTDNFGSKNSCSYLNKKVVIKQPKPVKEAKTQTSDIIGNWRNKPRPNSRKVERPSKEDLEKLLWEKPTAQLALDFGVSDKAIEKWAKSYGLNKPPRGFWAKQKKNEQD